MSSSDSLSSDIYGYYLEHFDDIPFDKQFHFASRLFLWSQDPAARPLLDRLRGEFTADGRPADALKAIYRKAAESPVHGSKNATELRRPYFEKYPRLKTYLMLLFRVAFLRTVYGVDARPALLALCPQEELDTQFRDLISDRQATAILSTHAANFVYLYSRFILEDETAFDPSLFLEIAQDSYDLSDKVQLQLCIYMYTHCIIGDSMFYHRPLPEANLPVYRTMVGKLEKLIGDNLTGVNLDNKFEFLVCARLAGMDSKLRAAIFDEAARSISDEGTYVIDRHNTNPQAIYTSLDKSEHRNVLLIMADRPFTPLG